MRSAETEERPDLQPDSIEDDELFDSDVGMPFWETVRIAWRALIGNRMRAGLTMLGIIIGIFAVIAMVSMGQSASAVVTKTINQLGTNLLIITAGSQRDRQQGIQPQTLTYDDAKIIAQRFPSTITGVAAACQGNATVKMGDKSENPQVGGVTPSYLSVANTPLREGRFISDEDVAGRTKVAVVGVSVIQHLLGDENLSPLGLTLLINRIPYRIIGVSAPKGSVFGQDQDDFVYVPITTALHRIYNRTFISDVQVQCASQQSMDLATEQITNLLRQRHNLHPPFPDGDDFQINNQAQILQTFGAISGVMTLLLGGLATISLLVGGIGIMNIMLVSVTERTREIGLRKAVGATRSDILVQFLIEAVLLSVVGGVIGLAVAIGVVAAAVSIIGWPLVISPGLVALAVLVSATVGIVFGSYPAAKAARQNPIDCLRYE